MYLSVLQGISTIILPYKNDPERSRSTLDIPRVIARWVSSKRLHGGESFGIPIK